MPASPLQDPFLAELAETFQATLRRLDLPPDAAERAAKELRGLFHGVLVIFDGGSALADRGLIRIVDEHGNAFDRNLHEDCFRFWPDATRP